MHCLAECLQLHGVSPKNTVMATALQTIADASTTANEYRAFLGGGGYRKLINITNSDDQAFFLSEKVHHLDDGIAGLVLARNVLVGNLANKKI